MPQKLTFTPIKTVRKWLKFESALDVVFQSIREESLARVVSVSQDLAETERKLVDLKNEILKGSHCVFPQNVTDVTDLVSQFSVEQAKFKGNLQNLLRHIRSGKKDVSELDQAISQLEESKFSKSKIEGKMSFSFEY